MDAELQDINSLAELIRLLRKKLVYISTSSAFPPALTFSIKGSLNHKHSGMCPWLFSLAAPSRSESE